MYPKVLFTLAKYAHPHELMNHLDQEDYSSEVISEAVKEALSAKNLDNAMILCQVLEQKRVLEDPEVLLDPLEDMLYQEVGFSGLSFPMALFGFNV